MPKTIIGKKGLKLVEIKKCGRFGIRVEKIQSDPPKEVKDQSCIIVMD